MMSKARGQQSEVSGQPEHPWSPEWLDEVDRVAAEYGFPPVRDFFEDLNDDNREYIGDTPAEAFQQGWLDYAEDDGE